MSHGQRTKTDLEVFAAVPKGSGHWADRLSLISELFPNVDNLDWLKAFRDDDDLFGAIVRDMMRLGAERKHTWGPRDMPEEDAARALWTQWKGEDHSVLSFGDTFAAMSDGFSQRQLARKTGLSRGMIRRLQDGTLEPDRWILESVAAGFKKQPSFFLEYRLLYVVNAMVGRMRLWPESSISVYRKLRQQDAN